MTNGHDFPAMLKMPDSLGRFGRTQNAPSLT